MTSGEYSYSMRWNPAVRQTCSLRSLWPTYMDFIIVHVDVYVCMMMVSVQKNVFCIFMFSYFLFRVGFESLMYALFFSFFPIFFS